jgi:hypothetical protein
MNKEQQELLDEVYEKYCKESKYKFLISKEAFTNTIKRNPDFAKEWGLKIEERELSLEERNEWHVKYRCGGNRRGCKDDWKDYELDQQGVPTKLITITYNDKTIESYES